ncbi:MAG: maleylacetoacetate isomerase [Candidimonas sp.]|nr:MAG: maleylacetoacetate isomerase [Candidimonas sp.]
MLTLYSYFRSSAAYRVRIALALKGLSFELIPVELVRHGGEQHSAAYRALNPQSLVPTLIDDGVILTQSLAIMEYLDEAYGPALLVPKDARARARVRSLAQMVACDIHPLDNLRVLRWLAHDMQVEKPARDQWYLHWIKTGFDALEARLQSPETGLCSHGDAPGLADCCLIPQVQNARSHSIDVSPWPTIKRIAEHCNSLAAFQAAHPDAQPDATS